MDEHVYTSRLGKDFLKWHEWVEKHKPIEVFIEFKNVIDNGGTNLLVEELFREWILDQKINSHRVYREGKLIEYDEF